MHGQVRHNPRHHRQKRKQHHLLRNKDGAVGMTGSLTTRLEAHGHSSDGGEFSRGMAARDQRLQIIQPE